MALADKLPKQAMEDAKDSYPEFAKPLVCGTARTAARFNFSEFNTAR
jgi:hypothetical protein